jgi:hypothetical protein
MLDLLLLAAAGAAPGKARSSNVDVDAHGACCPPSSGDSGETGDIIVLRAEEISEGGRVKYVLFSFLFVWVGYVLLVFLGAGSCVFWAKVVYAACVGGKRVSGEDNGLASLSLKAVALDFFFRCRRSRRMNIPSKARAATPPTTTPAMSAVEGPELLEEDAAADVEDTGSCEVVLLLVAVDIVAVDVVPVALAAADVIAAAMLVGLAGVGN